MRKLLCFVLLVFSISVISFAFEYWYLDVNVDGVRQRAYLFRDLRTMEQATGIPSNYYDWWVVGSSGARVDEYTRTILSAMRRDGLNAAFVLYDYSGGKYQYTIYSRANGRELFDVYITDRPIRL